MPAPKQIIFALSCTSAVNATMGNLVSRFSSFSISRIRFVAATPSHYFINRLTKGVKIRLKYMYLPLAYDDQKRP